MLKIRVLNVSKKELLKDLQRAAEFDQSATVQEGLRRRVRRVRRRALRRADRRLRVRRSIPKTSNCWRGCPTSPPAAHAPFITAAGPELFNLDSFTDLDTPRDLAKIFDTTEYAKWKSFRESEDARYVGLCAAAHPDAAAVRRATRSRSMASITKKPWTAPTTPSTSGATPRTRSALA